MICLNGICEWFNDDYKNHCCISTHLNDCLFKLTCQKPDLLLSARTAGSATDLDEMQIALRTADAIARIIDTFIKSGSINARSMLADARLDYGTPYEYKWSK